MESLLEINLDKENIYEWNIDVKNDSDVNDEPNVRFVIEASNLSFIVNAENNGKNIYSVSIPPLVKQLGEGDVKCRLEVIVADRYFVPWEAEAKTMRTIKVEAKKVVKKKEGIKITANIKESNKQKSRKRRKIRNENNTKIKSRSGEIIEIV